MPDGGGRPGARRRIRPLLGLERNDLRRPVDRAQRRVALGLLVLLAVIAVPFAIWAAGWAHGNGARAERAERADRRQVTATVVATGGVGSPGDRYLHETVQATWPREGAGSAGDEAAKTRTGTLPAWKGAEVGQQRRIWVDGEGDPAVPPRPHSRTVADAVYAAFAATLAPAVPLLLVYLLVRRRCDHHRDALWDEAWARLDADRGRNRPS